MWAVRSKHTSPESPARRILDELGHRQLLHGKAFREYPDLVVDYRGMRILVPGCL